MALTEATLLALALNLMNNPTDKDIQKYSELSQSEKIRIEEIVIEQDTLPYSFQNLKTKDVEDLMLHSPTWESSAGE